MWPYHPDLLERPVPRYTSYPTAAEFHDGIGEGEARAALERSTGDVSLYVHIPYCEQICWYCGCNTGAANRTHRLTAYLDALEEEIVTVAASLPATARISRIAFGGGSPNALSPIAFVRLFDRLMTAFRFDRPAISVEIDPRGLTPDWAMAMAATGATHASLGVQTFSPEIQARIGRVQPDAMIESAAALLRGRGITSLNFDLMYGLPGQGLTELEESLDKAIALAPERIALFGYAHVPHLLPRQKRIDASCLAGQQERFAMAAMGHDRLVAAGYVPVGFDHFALPTDGMAKAALSGTLRRNFQGFTDDQAERLIGLGASAISVFPELLLQNEKNAGRYRMRLSHGGLAATLGIARGEEDRVRARIIEDILCLRPANLLPLLQYGPMPTGVAVFLDRGLARLDGAMLIAEDALRPYARSLAVQFDKYRNCEKKQFSTAV